MRLTESVTLLGCSTQRISTVLGCILHPDAWEWLVDETAAKCPIQLNMMHCSIAERKYSLEHFNIHSICACPKSNIPIPCEFSARLLYHVKLTELVVPSPR